MRRSPPCTGLKLVKTDCLHAFNFMIKFEIFGVFVILLISVYVYDKLNCILSLNFFPRNSRLQN